MSAARIAAIARHSAEGIASQRTTQVRQFPTKDRAVRREGAAQISVGGGGVRQQLRHRGAAGLRRGAYILWE